MPDICAPTLHDRALWSKVAEVASLTPRSVREAARIVAGAGYAGRAPARAAEAAEAARRQARTMLHYNLLLELVRQVEPAGTGLPPPERDLPANVERRALAALSRLRTTGGVAPAAAVEVLGELAEVFEGCGLRRDAARDRLPMLAAEVATIAREVEIWSADEQDEARDCTRLLVQASELTLRCSRVAFTEAHVLLDDLWSLLQRWRAAPDEILAQLARPEWLLDG